MSLAVSLRPITLADAPAGRSLTQAVGWPHRLADWEMAIRLGGGVVALAGDEVIASALWFPYGERHATLGFVIVMPGRQGGGVGRRLMQALLDETAGRSLMLNATEAGEPLYARLGFAPFGGVRQYQGEIGAAPAPALGEGERLRPATAEDLPLLLALDRSATGLPREALLGTVLAMGEGVLLERGGAPVGFSLLRPFGRGHVIGPVVAPDEAAAHALIQHWLHARGGRFLRVDIRTGTGLDGWLADRGLELASEVVAMLRGEAPLACGPAKLYALVNQGLG